MEFNLLYYKLFNDDIVKQFKTDNQILYHYKKHGINEYRIKNENTFIKKYTNYYEKLPKFKRDYKELLDGVYNNINLEKNILLKKIYYTVTDFNKKYKCRISQYIKNKYVEIERIEFDYKFYGRIYRDLIENNAKTPNELFNHWLVHGKLTDRKKNLGMLKKYYFNNLNKCNFKINLDELYKEEELINILIRTTNRKDDFLKCINSILEQDYKNYRIIICYDKIESLDYLNYLKNVKNVEYFYINNKSKKKYKFNLYCNTLMDMVYKGWIIFMDDDKIFTNKYCLKIINSKLIKENNFIIWDFLRPDAIIKPNNIENIGLGEIDTSSFCFHNEKKHLGRWKDERASDYIFIKELLKNTNLKKVKIEKILVTTTFNDKIANFGE